MIPDNIGTPGPWKAGRELITREVLGEALAAIQQPRSGARLPSWRRLGRRPDGYPLGATAAEVAEAIRHHAQNPARVTGSSGLVDVSLQLLKRWHLIMYLRREGQWVPLTLCEGNDTAPNLADTYLWKRRS